MVEGSRAKGMCRIFAPMVGKQAALPSATHAAAWKVGHVEWGVEPDPREGELFASSGGITNRRHLQRRCRQGTLGYNGVY